MRIFPLKSAFKVSILTFRQAPMQSPVFIAGHRGMVGSAVCRRLENEPVDLLVRSRNELDLSDEKAVLSFFERFRPKR